MLNYQNTDRASLPYGVYQISTALLKYTPYGNREGRGVSELGLYLTQKVRAPIRAPSSISKIDMV
jgi:hypothetical protein